MALGANRIDIGPYRNIRLKANKQGYWEVWWTDARGGYVTKRESSREQVRAAAEQYLRTFCDNVRDQTQQIAAAAQPNQPTVDELCQGWLDQLEADKAYSKARTGRYNLVAIRRELGAMTLDQLTDGTLLRTYRRQRGVSDATILREIGGLRAVCLWAGRQRPRLIDLNDLPVFKELLPDKGPPRDLFLDQGQDAMFFAAAQDWGRDHPPEGWRIGVFVALGLDTSARRGAICDLTWDRVNLHNGLINYQNPRRAVTIKRRVKGVPISDRLLPVLKEAWLLAPKVAGQAVGPVLGITDPAKAARWIAREFPRFAAGVGMPWVTPHVLRHTYASLAAMAGQPMQDIAHVMGDDIKTVMDNYAHLAPGHLVAAVNFRNK
jgi:integrase